MIWNGLIKIKIKIKIKINTTFHFLNPSEAINGLKLTKFSESLNEFEQPMELEFIYQKITFFKAKF